MRVGDVTNLCWKDISVNGGRHFVSVVMQKNSKPISLPLPAKAFILESMTKYQQLDLSRYDHAIVFIRYSSCYPPDNTELETFRQAVHNRLGYENILFGTVVENNECEQIKVMLLLNKAV